MAADQIGAAWRGFERATPEVLNIRAGDSSNKPDLGQGETAAHAMQGLSFTMAYAFDARR